MNTLNSSLFVATVIASALVITISLSAVADPQPNEVNPKGSATTSDAPAVTAQVDSQRPKFFVSGMTLGGMMLEDSDNRLTNRSSRRIATGGMAFRGGGVIANHHLLGGLFQGAFSATDRVLDSQGGDGKDGAIVSLYAGPEYRYITHFGLYAGASVGLGFTLADNDIDYDDDPDEDCDSFDCFQDHMQKSDDHAAFSMGLRGTVGYEYRFNRYVAINVEMFAHWLIGEDEFEKSMDTSNYGLALGVGI